MRMVDRVLVDTSDLPFRPAPLSLDASCASIPWTSVDWPRSLQHMARGVRLAQDHVHDRTGTRKRSGRDPPGVAVATGLTAYRQTLFRPCRQCFCDRGQRETLGPPRD